MTLSQTDLEGLFRRMKGRTRTVRLTRTKIYVIRTGDGRVFRHVVKMVIKGRV
jgi:hypothetical protein